MPTAHQYQTYIRASAEEVWRAITDPAFTRQYFFGSAFASPPVAGQRFISEVDGQPAVDGVVEVVDPPHRLVHTWHVRYDDAMAAEPESRVEWTIEAAGAGLVLLRVRHGDLAFSPLTWASVRTGWVYVLDGLKSLLETGRPLPPRNEAVTPEPVAEQVAKDWHRMQGVEANNTTFDLLDDPSSAAEDVLRGAYTAAYHWARATGRLPVNEYRSQYLIGKAWLRARRPELALDYADQVIAGCAEHGLADFDLAYAHELRARALHALGRTREAAEAWRAANAVEIAEPEDAAILTQDFADFRQVMEAASEVGGRAVE